LHPLTAKLAGTTVYNDGSLRNLKAWAFTTDMANLAPEQALLASSVKTQKIPNMAAHDFSVVFRFGQLQSEGKQRSCRHDNGGAMAARPGKEVREILANDG
jgi:hypothetical protein